MLEDHPDTPAGRSQLGRRKAGERATGHRDGPRIWSLEHVDSANERALTRTALADHTEDLATCDLETHVIQCAHRIAGAPEGLTDVLKLNHAKSKVVNETSHDTGQHRHQV